MAYSVSHAPLKLCEEVLSDIHITETCNSLKAIIILQHTVRGYIVFVTSVRSSIHSSTFTSKFCVKPLLSLGCGTGRGDTPEPCSLAVAHSQIN